jgi:outer membrane protein assembly factor BamB
VRLVRALLAGAALSLFAAVPAQATDWSTFGFDSARTNENPRERILGPGSASSLREVWSAPLGGVVNAQPLVAANVRLPGGRRAQLVIAGAENGTLTALDAATGRPVWRRFLGAITIAKCRGDLPGGRYGVTSTPAIDRRHNRVYSADGRGRVHALDLATGREAAGWPVPVTPRPDREHIWSALARRGDRLYATLASHCSESFYRGRVTRIDARRHRIDAVWYSLPKRLRGGGVWGWGGAAIDAAAGDVFVATAGAAVVAEDTPYAEHVVRLGPRLSRVAANHPNVRNAGDADFSGAPLLYRAPGCPPQLAVLHKVGALLVYDRDRIAAGPRQTLQIGDRTRLAALGTYAYATSTRTLYVANNTTGDHPLGLLAFTVGAECTLQPAWQHALPADTATMSPPITAGGVVYLGTGTGRQLLAFDARTGARLWSSGRLDGALYGGPAVANGRVYAGAWDGRLHAFAPANG